MIELLITPKPKPRMVRSDAWRKRKVILDYWEYKDKLKLLAAQNNIVIGDVLGVAFVMPMPASWSEKKRKEMDGKPHQNKPDLDNNIKAVSDILLEEDCRVWKYDPPPYKIWGRVGKILFFNVGSTK